MPQGWTPVATAADGWTPVAPIPDEVPRDARGRPAVSSDLHEGGPSPLLEMLGPLAHPETFSDFARLLTLPVDTVRRAAASALTLAASRAPAGAALSATGRGMERAGAAVEGPAKMATAYEMVTDPKRAVLTLATPKVLQMAGRGLQRVGAAVTGPAVAEVAPVVAPVAEAGPVAAEAVAAPGIRPTGTGAALPDQKALNEAALLARREAYQASRGPVAVPPAEAIVKTSGKMQLTAPEFKEFQRLLKAGLSLPDAEQAVKTARDLARQLGAEPPPVSATKFPKGMRGRAPQ